MKHLKALNKYFWKYRYRLGIGIFFIVVSNYFNVLQPQIMGYMIEFVHRELGAALPHSKHRAYDITGHQVSLILLRD
jgi:ATP-binding cassette subfamily B protein